MLLEENLNGQLVIADMMKHFISPKLGPHVLNRDLIDFNNDPIVETLEEKSNKSSRRQVFKVLSSNITGFKKEDDQELDKSGIEDFAKNLKIMSRQSQRSSINDVSSSSRHTNSDKTETLL